MEAATAVGIGANTRQHDAVSRRHTFGIRRQFDLRRDTALKCCTLKSLGGRAQIAGAVIDDCNTHFQFSPRWPTNPMVEPNEE